MSFHDESYIRKKRKRYKGRRPYGAIDHIVIDSPAYACLKNSSVRLLNIMVRQLTEDNNGWLQATYSYCGSRGIRSENTLREAIRDLISHGFIVRTRSRGANGVCALYAVTWLSVRRKEGLFLHVFRKDAFDDWKGKNTIPKKLMIKRFNNCDSWKINRSILFKPGINI